MGQRVHVAQRAVEGGEHAAFLYEGRAGAEGAGALAAAGLALKVLFSEEVLVVGPESRVNPAESPLHLGRALFPGVEPGVLERQRGFPLEEGDAFAAHGRGLHAQDVAHRLQVALHGLVHGVQRGTLDAGVKEGLVQEVLHSALLIQGKAGAGQRVERGGAGVFEGRPGLVAALEGGAAHPAVGVAHQGAPARDRQRFNAAVRPAHLEGELGGDLVVEAVPGLEAVHGEVGRELLLGGAHGAAGALAHALEGVGDVPELFALDESGEHFFGHVLEGAQHIHAELGVRGSQEGQLGLFGCVFVLIGVGGGQAAGVGEDMPQAGLHIFGREQ